MRALITLIILGDQVQEISRVCRAYSYSYSILPSRASLIRDDRLGFMVFSVQCISLDRCNDILSFHRLLLSPARGLCVIMTSM